jgi:hypothetical protein
MTSDSDDLEEALRQNLKLRRELIPIRATVSLAGSLLHVGHAPSSG